MKQCKGAVVQTNHNRMIQFLISYNFQKVSFHLKRGNVSDKEILDSAHIRGRGRPQKKIKKPKNRVYEEIKNFMSVKERLDDLLDGLLSFIMKIPSVLKDSNLLFKKTNAYYAFNDAYLNAAISHSTNGTYQGQEDEIEDLSTKKTNILDFPMFSEIDTTIQIQIQHFVHYIIEIGLINKDSSFTLTAINELRNQMIICPYFTTAVFIIILSMLLPMDHFKYYLTAIYILLCAGRKNFDMLEQNLKVNINIPSTLKRISNVSNNEFAGFFNDFIDFAEIYIKGQSFSTAINRIDSQWEANPDNNLFKSQGLQRIIEGWKLTYYCISDLFYDNNTWEE